MNRWARHAQTSDIIAFIDSRQFDYHGRAPHEILRQQKPSWWAKVAEKADTDMPTVEQIATILEHYKMKQSNDDLATCMAILAAGGGAS